MILIKKIAHSTIHRLRDYHDYGKANLKKGDYYSLCENAADLIEILGGEEPSGKDMEGAGGDTITLIESLKVLREEGTKKKMNSSFIKEEFNKSLEYASKVMDNLKEILLYYQ